VHSATNQGNGCQGEPCAGVLCFASQGGNQTGPLDDEIGLGQGDLRRAAIGEKLEAANFVEDALAC
jgi:hypothetical protein